MFGIVWHCREASERSSDGPKLVRELLPVSCPGEPNKRKRDCREEEQENRETQDRDSLYRNVDAFTAVDLRRLSFSEMPTVVQWGAVQHLRGH